jgi:type VI secretion system protein ImpE
LILTDRPHAAMSNADDLLRTGDLDGARSALVEAARRNPGDISTRLFLFQLLAVIGDWEKSTKQLATLAQLSPEAQMLAVVYGQAIAAEQQRAAVFAGEVLAPIHGNAEWAVGIAEAIRLDAIGQHDDAASVRDTAFAEAPDTPGTLDGERFEWIADADARFGPCLEAIIGGQYGLLPFAEIANLKSEGPRDLRDVAWYPVEIMLKAGTSVAALLPTRYPGPVGSPEEQLARMTAWRDDGTGSGQHLWVLSTDEERGLLSVRALAFD